MALIFGFSVSVFADIPKASESLTSVEATDSKAPRFYTGIVLGMEGYPEVTNVDKGYNVNLQFGYFMQENIRLETGFGLAKSQLFATNNLISGRQDKFNIDQYQLLGSAKYELTEVLGTGVTPIVGAVLSYTYRSYNLLDGLTTNSGKTGSSSALDVGLSATVEYAFNKRYAAGLDLKYMFNLSHEVSSTYAKPSYGYNGVNIESLQYYIAGLSARMNF